MSHYPITPLHRTFLLPRFVRRYFAHKIVKKGDKARDGEHWTNAAMFYKNALIKVPHRYDLWVQYGHALKGMGLKEDSERAYRIALRIKPDCADTYLQLGHVLKLQCRLSEARVAYLEAQRCDPELPGLASEL